MAINNPVVIEKDSEAFPLTFAFLRKQGIELAQQFSGNQWTDFNLHDPGVTMLEQLCFAITDLSYRTEFPIEDMLADENGFIDRHTNLFIEREKAFTTKPVSIIDYRKYVMDDVAEIKNIWIDRQTALYTENYMKGVYRVTIQINEDVSENTLPSEAYVEDIKTKVLKSLERVRNICEDFNDIIALKQQKINVNAEIIITEEQPAEEILAHILFTLKAVTNPSLNYFTEKELIDQGYKIEEIYNGPLLKNGIMPDSEMKRRRTQIDATDLVNAIIGIKGVASVTNIWMRSNDKDYHNEPCCLQPYHYPILNSDTFLKNDTFINTITLYKNKFKIHLDKDKFLRCYQKLKEQSKREYISSLHQKEKEGQLFGKYRNIGKYYSIQDHFPLNYGIGKEGILSNKPAAEQAKVSQLKAYLMLFEQVLANYLSQLHNIPNLYAPYISGESHSYFFNPLYDVPNVAKILKSYTSLNNISTSGKKEWQNFVEDKNNGYVQHLSSITESKDVLKKRKNDMMDHLLARFNLSLAGNGVSLYNLYYNNGEADKEADTLLTWKAYILEHLNGIVQNRSRARSYNEAIDDRFKTKRHDTDDADKTIPTNRCFEQNIYLFLYIQNKCGKKISISSNSNDLEILPSATAEKSITQFIANTDTENTFQLSNQQTSIEVSEKIGAIIWDQPISFLVSGLNIKNYKIVPNPQQQGHFFLLYKKISTNEMDKDVPWKVIGQYTNEVSAVNMMDNTINAVKKLSLDTEGFHLIEHILLRPAFTSASFGFQFLDKKDHILFTQKEWLTYEQRENIIKELLDKSLKYNEAIERAPLNFQQTTNGQNVPTYNQEQTIALDVFEKALLKYCKLNTTFDVQDNGHKWLKDINYSLQKIPNIISDIFPRFLYSVRISDQITINEEFYNYRNSYIFPSWPARFQDLGFRSFCKSVLREYSPAHVQSSTYWLKPQEMKDFEDQYFSWWESLKTKKNTATDINYQIKLTIYLAKEHYIIHPIQTCLP